MKFEKAKEQLEYALKHQKSITTNKLKKIMQAMNISLSPSRDTEIEYLKNEIKKLTKRNRRLERNK